MAAKADWAAYLRRYPDLKEAFGDDKKLAEKHWFEYGFNEKRNPLPEGMELEDADSDDDTASTASAPEERRESEQYGESIGSLSLSIV